MDVRIRSSVRLWSYACCALAIAAVSGAAGCDVQAPDDADPVVRQGALTAPVDVMGFEPASAWTASSGTVSSAGQKTQGLGALALAAPVNYTTLHSVPIASNTPQLMGIGAAASSMAVDVLLPTQQPNPSYFGALQLYANAPSRNLYNQYLGQVELTGQPLGSFRTLAFPVSDLVRGALGAGSFSDLTFTLALNAPSGATGTYLFDNLRVRAAGNAEFSLSVGGAISLPRGASRTVAISIARSGGFAASVSFSASGLPSGVTATFAPAASSDAATTLTLTASAEAAPLGDSVAVVTGTGGGLSRTVALPLTLLLAPPVAAFDWTVAPHFPGFESLPTDAPPPACQLPPHLVGVPGFFTLACTVGGEPGCRIVFQNQAGTINGDCTPLPNQSPACQLACGARGIEINGICVGVELCNGKDDDCDGVIDNGGVCQLPHSLLAIGVKPQYENPLPPVPTIACQLPPELQGVPGFFSLPCGAVNGAPACQPWFTNQAGTLQAGACAPPPCSPGSRASCALSCGATGTHVCNADGSWPACQGIERCNSADDDCDGAIDEGGVCQLNLPPGLATPPPPGSDPVLPPIPTPVCTLPPHLQGIPGFFTLPCGAVDGVPSCQPWFTNQAGTIQAGACEPPPCAPGTVASCQLGCGGTGTRSCQADGKWTSCTGSCSVPLGWDTELDACGSASLGSPIVEYVWDVQLPDRPVHFATMSCRTDFIFPTEGTYPVTLTVTGQDGTTGLLRSEVVIKNHVILSLGDSIASGEGNPDVPRGPNVANAVWENRRCHRSLKAGHALAARDVELADRHSSVTFLPLACSGATIPDGLLGFYAGQEPDGVFEAAQVFRAKSILAPHPRKIDALLLQIGANDIGFGKRVQECAIPPFQRPDTGTILAASVFNPIALALLAVPSDLDLTSCATSNNIDFVNGLLEDLIGIPNVNLASRYATLQAALATNLDVAASRIYIADYPDPTSFANGFCDEIRLRGAVADNFVGRVPTAGASFLLGLVTGPVLGAIRLFQTQTDDGIVTEPEVIFAHDKIVVPLNAAVQTAAATFNWRHVPGVNVAAEFGSHGYCGQGSNRWFRQYDESKTLQGNESGTLHPNVQGHDAYRRHLSPVLLEDLLN